MSLFHSKLPTGCFWLTGQPHKLYPSGYIRHMSYLFFLLLTIKEFFVSYCQLVIIATPSYVPRLAMRYILFSVKSLQIILVYF